METQIKNTTEYSVVFFVTISYWIELIFSVNDENGYAHSTVVYFPVLTLRRSVPGVPHIPYF